MMTVSLVRGPYYGSSPSDKGDQTLLYGKSRDIPTLRGTGFGKRSIDGQVRLFNSRGLCRKHDGYPPFHESVFMDIYGRWQFMCNLEREMKLFQNFQRTGEGLPSLHKYTTTHPLPPMRKGAESWDDGHSYSQNHNKGAPLKVSVQVRGRRILLGRRILQEEQGVRAMDVGIIMEGITEERVGARQMVGQLPPACCRVYPGLHRRKF